MMTSLSNFPLGLSTNHRVAASTNDCSPSPVWGRSAAITFKAMSSPIRLKDNGTPVVTPCQKSPSKTMSPVRSSMKETSNSSHRTHRSHQSYDSFGLATISEDRRISSNTLNKITVTKTTKELTAAMTESRIETCETEEKNPYFDENKNDTNESDACFGCVSRPKFPEYFAFTRHLFDSRRSIHE
mmetsp:Transcript_1163/g.1480  ORF Transcript_1163/g.1480 Transcript_1163/m.1480 type:complete len:185 (-) Transcript_1163:67-621(-)